MARERTGDKVPAHSPRPCRTCRQERWVDNELPPSGADTTTSSNYDLTRVAVAKNLIEDGLRTAWPDRDLSTLKLLDGGCGTGNYIGALRGTVGAVQGLEFNDGMFALCSAKFADAPDVTVTQGSIIEMPFADGEFDGVMINQVIHHLDDAHVPGGKRWGAVSAAFAEVFRVLKPGGVFCLNHQHRNQTTDGDERFIATHSLTVSQLLLSVLRVG
eukprot:SAG11_NODE_3430_length_2451_cov_1.846939_3_plen_215_part_00